MTGKDLNLIESEIIESKIYSLRGQRIMFDFGLAQLYEVKTKALKQAVKRNFARFPEDFMFELTKAEWREVVTNCDHLPVTKVLSLFEIFFGKQISNSFINAVFFKL